MRASLLRPLVFHEARRMLCILPWSSLDCSTVDSQQVFVDDANLTRQIKQMHSQPVFVRKMLTVFLFGFVFKARKKKKGDCPHLVEFCFLSFFWYITVSFSVKFVQQNVRKNKSNWTTKEHRGPKPFLHTTGWWVRWPAGELTLRSSLLISDVFSDDDDLFTPPTQSEAKTFYFLQGLAIWPTLYLTSEGNEQMRSHLASAWVHRSVQ